MEAGKESIAPLVLSEALEREHHFHTDQAWHITVRLNHTAKSTKLPARAGAKCLFVFKYSDFAY